MVVYLKNICPSTNILVAYDIYKNNALLYQYLVIDIIARLQNICFMKKAKEKVRA